MAEFIDKQKRYIENTVALSIGRQSDQIGTSMAEGKVQQDEMRALVVKHD